MVNTNSRIVYTTNQGEKIAIPQGNPITVGDRVLINHTPDGRLITTGNNKIELGDKVVVLTTNQGEKVSVSVRESVTPPTPYDDFAWAWILPFAPNYYHRYMVLGLKDDGPNLSDSVISGSNVLLPACTMVTLNISLDVFTVGSVVYRPQIILNNSNHDIISAEGFISTEFNESDLDHTGDWEFYHEYYTIPVFPGWATISLGTAFGPVMAAGGQFSIVIPANTLGLYTESQININPPPVLNYFKFPPHNFHGQWTLKAFMARTEIEANPNLYQLVG